MGNLIETEGWQVELIVNLEYILEGWQCIDNMPVVDLRMLVNFHASGAATHYKFIFLIELNL